MAHPPRWPEQEIEECMLDGDTYVPVGELFFAPRRGGAAGRWIWRSMGMLALLGLGTGLAEGCDRFSTSAPVPPEPTLRASQERLRARYSDHLGREITTQELDAILTGDDSPPDDGS